MGRKVIVGVVGNPNCGKTTLFNALTGARQRVGNWPGVTVERKTGRYSFEGIEFELVDLPGTYSLEVADEGVSADERIARDYVASREADLILNIVDASNLERNLYLTSQLIEMKVPLVVVLNMMDAAGDAGILVDVPGLAAALGCPVLPVVASSGKGIPALRAAIRDAALASPVPPGSIPYGAAVERAVAALLPGIDTLARAQKADPRWLALRLLEGDRTARQLAGEPLAGRVAEMQRAVESEIGDDIDISLADARYGFVGGLVAGTVRRRGRASRSLSDRIDRVVLNRALGIPVFLIAMHLMFMFTINIGGAFIDAFDIVTGAIAVDGFAHLLERIGTPDWLVAILADGIGGGVQVVATFIPVVGFLFLFLSFLEDSGYMARAAFVMDRFLRGIGLPGKSFVPMIVGFGCTVPAVMATRTLETERDRKMTIAMAPFMSCGARLPVYALFAAAFFASYGQNVVFLLYLIGILVAVLTGLILKHTLLRGEVTPFVMELPPYRLPTLRGILAHVGEKTGSYLRKAGTVILAASVLIWAVTTFPLAPEGATPDEALAYSAAGRAGKAVEPLLSPLGFDWKIGVAAVTGFAAKEVVVSTLGVLYRTDLDGSEAGPRGLAERLKEDSGMTPLVAFVLMLFVLVMPPCLAALAAIKAELGWRWLAFEAAYLAALSWALAFLVYRGGLLLGLGA